ncbi:MAG: hypothetical protein IJ830_06780 [Alphaproteobacteria bacterium]|nr:hypothetical protein [Alphaproteobacteria bacterium]
MNMEKWLKYLEAEGDDEKSKVIKFIILWMAYNQWYNETYPKINGDKNRALQLSQDCKASTAYKDLKTKFLNSFKYISSVDCEDGQRDRLWKDSEKENEILFNDQNCDLKQFLTLTYQIRCNFFHGSKEYDEANKKLIAWAYDSLHLLFKTLQIDIEHQ